jgi:hypothetical protein
MAFGSNDVSTILEAYKKGQKWLDDVDIEIVGGENDIDPLVMLRIYDDKPTVDNELILASGFCQNRVVRFIYKGNVIHQVDYKGGNLAEHFMGKPYLLDVLLKMSYSLMLKKLTPPSTDSESEERQ